ncbi:MAG: metallophosphoesterase [Verrucomicrobiales bacterium]|nr:metallophosphoesterase [Verrucomicrobiales bacterium]
MKRRKFISRTALGASALSAGAWDSSADEPNRNRYPFETIEEAFEACDFDPTVDENAFFAVAADCHYGMCDEEGLLPIIEELNGMSARPAFFLVNGDLAVSASVSFGVRPSEPQRKAAHQEFLKCRQHLDRLDREIPVKLTIGNHDTSPDEDEPEMFHEVFPEHPAYQSFELAGAHVVLLNGHGDGRIDQKQADWFAADIAKIDSQQEVITCIHQPSMAGIVRERMIAPAYERAFSDHRGKVWAVCGHVHTNGNQVFQLPKTTVAQASITCSAKGIWGDAEKPGYWLYLLQDGKVAHRVFRRIDQGFRLQPLPNRERSRTIDKPFAHTRNVVWKTLIGEADKPFLVDGKEAKDNISTWCYVRRLVYRLPIADYDASHVAILAAVSDRHKDGSPPASIRLSNDNST